MEYHEKLRIKNSLLQSQKKVNNFNLLNLFIYKILFQFQKNIKVSFWTHAICPFNSKTIDKNLDSLNRDLKSNCTHKNDSYKKLDNRHNKNLDVILSPKDNISDTNNEGTLNVCESLKTGLEESKNDTCTNMSLIKTISDKNVNADQVLKNCKNHQNKMNDVENEQMMKECDFNLLTNKRKTIETQQHFEFKKPYYLIKDKICIDENLVNSKTAQLKISKKVFFILISS